MKKIRILALIALTTILLASCSTQISPIEQEANLKLAFIKDCEQAGNIDYLNSKYEDGSCYIEQNLYEPVGSIKEFKYGINELDSFKPFKGAKKTQEICYSIPKEIETIQELVSEGNLSEEDLAPLTYYLSPVNIADPLINDLSFAYITGAKISKSDRQIGCKISYKNGNHLTLIKPKIFYFNNEINKIIYNEKIKSEKESEIKNERIKIDSAWKEAAIKFDKDKGYNSKKLEGLYVQGEFNIYEIYQKCKNNTYITPRAMENECEDVIEFQEKYLK